MLEPPRIPRYRAPEEDAGDNASGADNQQERLVDLGWVLGFVDGEGCFSLGLVRQPSRDGRSGYRAGYQVFHEFVVTQGERSLQCLKDLQDFFGIGSVVITRRTAGRREPVHRYVVRKRDELLTVVIPFFERHPLRSAKRHDFEKFAACVRRMERKDHLTNDGLVAIVEVIGTMNRQKPRDELIRILRGHTPDAWGTR
jgi:LAGLIDADG endonuclease